MLLKLILIALLTLFISSAIKQYSSEISKLVSIAGGILITFLCLDEIMSVIQMISELYMQTNFDISAIKTIIKIIIIGYITEFTADIAEDFGNKNISSKVVLGGKLVICGICLPLLKQLLSSLFALL